MLQDGERSTTYFVDDPHADHTSVGKAFDKNGERQAALHSFRAVRPSSRNGLPFALRPTLYALRPTPYALNLKFKPQVLDPKLKPSAQAAMRSFRLLDPRPQNPGPLTLNSRPSSLNSRPIP